MFADDKLARPWADRTAIGLSGLCAVHCLLLPVAMTLLPAIGGLGLDDERFHLWMVIVVIPVSAWALWSGCRQHKDMSVLALGVIGLLALAAALALGHDILGEYGEQGLTLTGALLIAWSHFRNYRLCQKTPDCECSD